MADETTTTSYEEVVPTEYIPAWIKGFPYAAGVGRTVAWTVPHQGTIAYRFPRHESFAVPAGTKTQGASFTRVAATTTESSITPGIVGAELAITDELMAGSVVRGVKESMLANAANALANRIDTDILAAAASATTTVGVATDSFTKDKFDAAVGAYWALNLNTAGMHSCVLSGATAARDLLSDLGSSAATLAPMGVSIFGPNTGYKGEFMGFQLFVSNNVVADGGGRMNFMTPMGPMESGLGFVLCEDISARANRGAEGERDAEVTVVIRAWFGSGIADPLRILGVRSR